MARQHVDKAKRQILVDQHFHATDPRSRRSRSAANAKQARMSSLVSSGKSARISASSARATSSDGSIRRNRSRNTIQRPAAHTVGLYDTKFAAEANFPLSLHQFLEPLQKYDWRRCREPKQDNAARCRQPPVKGELTKILVACQDDSGVFLCCGKQRRISTAGHVRSCPDDVVSGLPQPIHRDSRKVLVGEK